MRELFTITNTIILITCLVSVAAWTYEKVMEDMVFWPAEIDRRKQYFRFLSYGLIHADFFHLAFNMYALYVFGKYVETYLFTQFFLFGEKAKIFYLVLYVTAIIVSPIPDYFINRNNPAYRALGASGAVSAVIFACILLHPKIPIMMLFIPIPMPGYLFGFLFLALSAYLARKGSSNIGHGAHLTGAIYGLLFTIVTTYLYADYEGVKTFINIILNRQ